MFEDKVIVVASKNKGKIVEFKELLEPKGFVVKSLYDFEDFGDIDETGTSFKENAIIKAQAVTDRFGIAAISDDSGLCIDAFDGEPGIHSARYLGHDTDYTIKNQIILDRMKEEKDRGCHYTCAIALTRKDFAPVVFEAICEGEIALEAKGENGFGYDPIVYYPPLGKTMAEMSEAEKNSISHRGKAVEQFEAWLNGQ